MIPTVIPTMTPTMIPTMIAAGTLAGTTPAARGASEEHPPVGVEKPGAGVPPLPRSWT